MGFLGLTGFGGGATGLAQAGGEGEFDPRDHFDVTLWTGNGSSPRTITQDGNFTPDLIWNKARSHGYHHYVHDSVRGFGSNKELVPSGTYQEGDTSNHNTPAHGYVSGAGSGSFTLGAGSSNNLYNNGSGETYVAWTWNAGGSTVSNTDGSITSSVRANPTAGFSIVSYTGSGSNATVGHGLETAPAMVILKGRNFADNWRIYHKDLHATEPEDYYIMLESSNGRSGDQNTSFMNSTQPTSTVFSLGTDSAINGSNRTMIAYCWSELEGYSKFGLYEGNGSADGTFVWCGFKPRLVILKNIDNSARWFMYDSARDEYNEGNKALYPDRSDPESTTYPIDFLSNGFKLRYADSGGYSNYASTYTFAAWAETPFKYSNAR